jgi:hypothetical protein
VHREVVALGSFRPPIVYGAREVLSQYARSDSNGRPAASKSRKAKPAKAIKIRRLGPFAKRGAAQVPQIKPTAPRTMGRRRTAWDRVMDDDDEFGGRKRK